VRRIASVGHAFFAAMMIALGVIGLVTGDFTPVWQPLLKGVPAHAGLAYLTAFISLVCGVGLFVERTAAIAARVLLASLVLWFVLLRVPAIFTAPTAQDSWSGCGETAVIVAAAWVLYVWFAADWDERRAGFATGERGLRIARVLYALSMIVFGEAHFRYINETAGLVPAWLPFHLGWAYFTGAAFVAAGIAMLAGVWARLAAALSAAQMGVFTLLVWVPIVASGSREAFQLSETILSFVLTAAGWVVAESYRNVSSRAANRR